MKTVGQILDENRGIGPGFDLMRVVLAFGVIGWHSVALTQGPAVVNNAHWWILVYGLVPVFFALSGFLVTASATRLTVGPFIASRALRIVPALFVDTVISILLFGTLLTTLPVWDYLTNKQTLIYWLNIVGEIHFELPGVFKHNPMDAVNGSLWTIKPELGCYAMMTLLIVTGWVKKWPIVATAFLGLWAVSFAASLVPGHFTGKFYLAGDHAKLVIFFLAGSLAFQLRGHIPASKWLALASVAFLVLCAIFGHGGTLIPSRPFMIVAIAPLIYLMVWLGLQKLPQVPFFKTGDYSYGVYLYGFPIQQVVIYLTHTRTPIVVFLLTALPVTLMATFSWHVVEKPMLRLRKLLVAKPARTVPAATAAKAPTTAGAA